MEKSIQLVFTAALAVILTGCAANTQVQTNGFTKKTQAGLIAKAKTYPKQAFIAGKVPPKSYVKVSGKIVKTDASGQKIQRGDRFILQAGKLKVQVFNQAQPVRLGARVTVYGEYNGFIQGNVIQASGE